MHNSSEEELRPRKQSLSNGLALKRRIHAMLNWQGKGQQRIQDTFATMNIFFLSIPIHPTICMCKFTVQFIGFRLKLINHLSVTAKCRQLKYQKSFSLSIRKKNKNNNKNHIYKNYINRIPKIVSNTSLTQSSI